MRNNLLIFIFLLGSNFLFAQDIIETVKGDTIRAKVLEISETEIIYKRESNPDDPTYRTSINTIKRITYKSGFVENYNTGSANAGKSDGKEENTREVETGSAALQPEEEKKDDSAEMDSLGIKPRKLLYMPSVGAHFSLYYMELKLNPNKSILGMYFGFRSEFFPVSNKVDEIVNTGDIRAGGSQVPFGAYAPVGRSEIGRTSLTFGMVFNLSEHWLYTYVGAGIGQYFQYDLYDWWIDQNYQETVWVRNSDVSTYLGAELESGLMIDFGPVLTVGFTSNNFNHFVWTAGIGFSYH